MPVTPEPLSFTTAFQSARQYILEQHGEGGWARVRDTMRERHGIALPPEFETGIWLPTHWFVTTLNVDDIQGSDEDVDIWYLRAQLALFGFLYIYGGYEDQELDFQDTSTDLYRLGAGVHFGGVRNGARNFISGRSLAQEFDVLGPRQRDERAHSSFGAGIEKPTRRAVINAYNG